MRLDRAEIGVTRLDRRTRIAVGATPIRVTAEGWKVYEGTATMGNVILPYQNPLRLEFRPEEEATSDEAVESMEGVPITNDHPDDLLDPNTVKEHTEGAVLKAWKESGEFPKIRVRLIVYTKALQDQIEAGKVELSPGYNTDPDLSPGEYKGQPFHVVQRRVKYNHLAVVDQARTRAPDGSVARLDKEDTMDNKNTGEVETNEADATARNDAKRSDMLSEESMAMVAKMPEADQKMIMEALEAKASTAADEVNVEIEGGESGSEEEEVMDKAMKDQLDALAADMAMLKDMMGKRGDSAVSTGHRLDAAEVIRKAEESARKAAEAQTSSLLRDLDLCRSAGVRVDGHDSTAAFAAMLGTIGEHTPDLKAAAERALKSGRLDDVRDFFNSAAAVGKAKRADSNANTIGEIVFGGDESGVEIPEHINL